jgi:RNA polymerase sigma factor (sigma-70 family)
MSEATASVSHGHVPVASLRLLSDERLARRVAEGDRQAFAALYQRHHQALYRYCRGILGNAEDAADALQSTMAAALRALPGEQREIRVKPWLYRIAHNESITLLRRRPPHAGLEEALHVAAPPGSDAATRERLRQLVTDLRELQDRQRAALVMRELSGLEYEEIGGVLESTPAAAKQLVYEARTALHEMADGRDMSCESIRLSLSSEDRRRLRGRKLRAHLKECTGCREFQRMMDVRRRDLAAVAPPLPAIAAAAILHGLGGGAHGGAAGGLVGLAGGGTGKAVATSAVVKGLAAAAVVATVGTGTAGLTGHLPGSGPSKAPRQAEGAGRGPSPATKQAAPASSGASQRRRSGAGPAHRGEAPREQHADGSLTPPQAHGRGQSAHPQPGARGRRGSRPLVTPRRGKSRPPVHPQRKGGRAGPRSGDHKKALSNSPETVTSPKGRPADLAAGAPATTHP